MSRIYDKFTLAPDLGGAEFRYSVTFLNGGDYPSVISPGLWLFTIVLIEVPIAILANCGQTDDEQRAMTKAHLTFDRFS